MSNMATKSDFAQKLLHDLRLRKEKMSASRQSNQTSRVLHGNSGQTSRSSRRINTPESASSKTGNASRMSNGSSSSRSVGNKEPSNQIILYDSRQSSTQVRDLSMAIAFAFENSGNLTKIGASTTNPLVNFFNRFGRRSSHKMEVTSFHHNQAPHITEISRGVNKLNQILRACSNGLNLDRNSVQVGTELLKGAIDLEEALRMLVNLQDGAQKKSRIKLLDEDEDENYDHHWKLDRPTFSFDRQGARRRPQLALPYTHQTPEQAISNSKLVVREFRQEKLIGNSSPSQEKGRISNVIAKLMGLEEISLDYDPKNDSKGKPAKVETNKKPNSTLPARESKLQLKPRETIKKIDPFVGGNQGNGQQNIEDSRRKQSKSTESPSKMLTLQQKRLKAARSIEAEVSNNLMEKRNVDKDFPTKVPKRGDHSRRADQQIQKQNPTEKHHQDSMIASKSKTSTATNGQNKLVRDKSTEKCPPNRRQRDAAVSSDINQKPAISEEHLDQSSNSKPQKKSIPRKVERSEIPHKMVSRRNATATTAKQAANMIKGLKQQMHNKNRSSKKSESKAEEGINVSQYMSEAVLKLNDKLENERFNSNTTAPQNTQSLNDNDLQCGSEADHKLMEQSNALKVEQQLKQCDQSIGDNEEIRKVDNEEIRKADNDIHNKYEQLTEDEKQLKETLIKSQVFLSTAEALFKLNIPLSFLHAAGDHSSAETKLLLDCAYEVMKRKARRFEAAADMRSLDDLVKQLCRDLEKLKAYEGDVAAGLYRMLDRDICNESPDVNCMWDFGGRKRMSVFDETEDVVEDVEKHCLNGLLDEIAIDFLQLSVSASWTRF